MSDCEMAVLGFNPLVTGPKMLTSLKQGFDEKETVLSWPLTAFAARLTKTTKFFILIN